VKAALLQIAPFVLAVIVVAVFGLWIFSKFFGNIKTLREEA